MFRDRRREEESRGRRGRRNEQRVAASSSGSDRAAATKEEEEKAYEAKLEAEKSNPRCVECEICCEPRAPHRIITCDNRREPHSYCEVCVRHHLKDTIFERSSPFLRCLAPGCVAPYQRVDYERILEAKTLAMRDRLETRMTLKNIEGLTPCPSCDFAAFVDEGVEVFECQNASCRKSFCLKCNGDPHPGVSCRQAGKRRQDASAKADPAQKLNELRRRVEDEISEALIRRCGDCNAPFVKAEGCNEMRCMCGNVTCYACRAQHITPRHWDRGCKHFEATEEREDQERKSAEKKAIAKVIRENPELKLKAEDLKVGEVSERVKRDDQRKKRREQAELRGELWMPGMAIDGGDRDLMADMQAQMEGFDPFDRRDMGNFIAPPFPIPPGNVEPHPAWDTDFGGRGRRGAVDLGHPLQADRGPAMEILIRRTPQTPPRFDNHPPDERQVIEREALFDRVVRGQQMHRDILADHTRNIANAGRMLQTAMQAAGFPRPLHEPVRHEPNVQLVGPAWDPQRFREQLANHEPNLEWERARFPPVFINGEAVHRGENNAHRLIGRRPRERTPPPNVAQVRRQRVEEFLEQANEPEYMFEGEMLERTRRRRR